MKIPWKTLRIGYIMKKGVWKASFLALTLLLMSLGMVIPTSATSSANTTLEIEWEIIFPILGNDGAGGLVQTADGGFVVLSGGEINYTLIKITANGKHEWNTTFKPLESFDFYGRKGFVQTADEGYVILGHIGDFLDNGADVFLYKFNATGKQEWTSTFGGDKSDWMLSMIPTQDGGLVLAGGTNYNDSLPIPLRKDYDMWLVKTDSQGVPEWNRTIGGEKSDLAGAVIQTLDGGYAITGRTDSYGLDDTHTWLVKTNVNGQPEWNKTFDGPMGMSLIQIADGSYIIGGDNDYWFMKTDANGTYIWDQIYTSHRNDEFKYVIQTADGGYLLGGDSLGLHYDIWFVKTDMNGQQEWNATLGDSGTERMNSFIQLSDESFIIAGSYFSDDMDTLTDTWLVKVQVTEETVTTTGFEYGIFILNLIVVFYLSRKRR